MQQVASGNSMDVHDKHYVFLLDLLGSLKL